MAKITKKINKVRINKVKICFAILGLFVLSIFLNIYHKSNQENKPLLERTRANKTLLEITSVQDLSKFINGTLIVRQADTHCGWIDTSAGFIRYRDYKYICNPYEIIWVGTNIEKKELITILNNTAEDQLWTNLHAGSYYYRKNERFYIEYQVNSSLSEASNSYLSTHYDGLGLLVTDAAKSGKYKNIYQVKLEKDAKWGSIYE